VLTNLEKSWHSLKVLLKSIGKLRKVLPFAEGVVKKVIASLEMCWHSEMELLKKF
jgi:hypothetical protein